MIECPDRPFCEPGLEKTYGLKITKVLPLGFGTPQAKQAVVDGKADLALTGPPTRRCRPSAWCC